MAAIAVAAAVLPREAARLSLIRSVDWLSLALLALALAALAIGLKEGPQRGWVSEFVPGLLALAAVSGGGLRTA